MKALRITAVAGSVLLWFAIPSFGQTNLIASLSRPATGIGSSGTWTANSIASITLINNSSKLADKNNTLFADGHFRNSSDSQGNGKPGKPHDPPQPPHDPHGGSVSAAEGGAATNYLILAGIACCAAIFLKRKQWDGRDQA